MKTDIQKIKSNSKILFDLVSVEDANAVINKEFKYLFLAHPYANSAFVMDNESKQLVNIIEDKKAFERYRNFIFELIDKAENLYKIVLLVNKPYLLLWFDLVNPYLGTKDYADLLKHVWTTSENPNMDVNINTKTSLEYFKKANKDYLMDEEEKKVYDFYKEEMVLYRGVSKGRTPFGLSYTPNVGKAIWFQNRFSKDEGYLIELTVKKEDCICYLNSRDEQEVIVNIFNYIDEIKAQIPKG